jgi:uncharacterized protein YbjT (DUF2867 family)
MSQVEASPRRTVLVVGANGFLGGHVAAALRRAGFHVLRDVRPRTNGASTSRR